MRSCLDFSQASTGGLSKSFGRVSYVWNVSAKARLFALRDACALKYTETEHKCRRCAPFGRFTRQLDQSPSHTMATALPPGPVRYFATRRGAGYPMANVLSPFLVRDVMSYGVEWVNETDDCSVAARLMLQVFLLTFISFSLFRISVRISLSVLFSIVAEHWSSARQGREWFSSRNCHVLSLSYLSLSLSISLLFFPSCFYVCA
jgi:hypothetical protein